MTDQQIAEQIVMTQGHAEFAHGDYRWFNVHNLLDRIVEALTLARSEGREEGMKEKDDLSRRDLEGACGTCEHLMALHPRGRCVVAKCGCVDGCRPPSEENDDQPSPETKGSER